MNIAPARARVGLTIRGTNFEIGRVLAQVAIDRYDRASGDFAANPMFAGARKSYFEGHYPIQAERARGVAKTFGVAPTDARYDLSNLPYNTDVPVPPPACSVVYYPPSSTAAGGGLLSRNYDFSIGTIADLAQLPVPAEIARQMPAIMSEPYLMRWYPTDGGYASLAIHCFDLLSGTLDGINSEGLVVAILADDEAITILGPGIERHPRCPQAVGLHELQVMRMLLDTCASADEARAALLATKQFYSFAPCHYVVADRSGDSFIYEISLGRNVEHIIDGSGGPQWLTNFELYRHADAAAAPAGELTLETEALWRYRTLAERLGAHHGPFTRDEVKTINACVSSAALNERMGRAAGVNARTLWHAVYDQDARAVELSFFLGEDERGERRSDYLPFSLG
jgi:hypothetical protein